MTETNEGIKRLKLLHEKAKARKEKNERILSELGRTSTEGIATESAVESASEISGESSERVE